MARKASLDQEGHLLSEGEVRNLASEEESAVSDCRLPMTDGYFKPLGLSSRRSGLWDTRISQCIQ